MSGSGLDSKPRPPAFPPDGSEELLIKAFARLDPTALAVAVATLLGLAIFSATLLLVLKGGDPPGVAVWLRHRLHPGRADGYSPQCNACTLSTIRQKEGRAVLAP